MSKILKLNSYSKYDELGDRDYMVYEVEYDDGYKDYVSRDNFRKLKALEIIKRNPRHVVDALELYNNFDEYYNELVGRIKMYIKSEEEWDLLKEALNDE